MPVHNATIGSLDLVVVQVEGGDNCISRTYSLPAPAVAAIPTGTLMGFADDDIGLYGDADVTLHGVLKNPVVAGDTEATLIVFGFVNKDVLVKKAATLESADIRELEKRHIYPV